MATRKTVKKKVAKKRITKTVEQEARERLAKQGRVVDEADTPVIGKDKVRRITKEDRKVRSG